MKPATFDLVCPRTVDEALALLADDSIEARALAGGQSLVPLMNFRLSRPERLVSLNHVAELANLATDAGDLVIGSMVRQRVAERSPTVAGWCPLLCEALGYVAHPAIRNRGTVGGSIAHADPSAELPALAMVLGARMVVRGPAGERIIEARDFFAGPFETALNYGELLTAIRLPRAGTHHGYGVAEVARRRGDFAIAGAMAALEVADGLVQAADMVLFGVGSSPIAVPGAAQLVGAQPTQHVVDQVAHQAAEAIQPRGDQHASAAFRAHLTAVVARRALSSAVARTSGSSTSPR